MEVSDRILLGNGGYRLWGGLLFWLPAAAVFSLLCCPHPPDPLPGGKGETKVISGKGLRPLHPRGLGGMRHWVCLRKAGCGGGLAFLVACLPSTLAFDSAPIPPTPFPAGRGRPRLFQARGFAPCIPGAGWDAALGLLVESGLWRGACLLGCLPPLPLAFASAPIPPSPQPPSRREGGNQGYFMQGASPLASPGLGGMRHWVCLRKAGCGGGGACRLCRLPTLPGTFSFFHPHFPAGR